MRITRRQSIRLSWLFGLALVAGMMAQRPQTVAPPASAMAPDSVPYCPHEWGPYISGRGDSLLTPDQASLPGAFTNIPEFHDCQRFVVAGSDRMAYHGLFVVWGAWDLEARYIQLAAYRPSVAPSRPTMTVDSVRELRARSYPFTPRIVSSVGSAPRPSRTTLIAWGFTEIYAEAPYPPLGVAEGFNCAYFYFAGDVLEAKMVNYGSAEKDCSAPVNPGTLPGTVLEVQRTQHPAHPDSEDYPPVARWDWDAKNKIHYFGVKCGNAWCEVGPGSFQPSVLPTAPTSLPSDVPLPSNWHRVFHIKGWFDEQQMDSVGVFNPRAPHTVRAAMFPDPNLIRLSKESFRDTWRTTAWVRLDPPRVGYEHKLNLLPVASGPEARMNRMQLCWGSWMSCVGSVKGMWLLFNNVCSSPDPMEITEDHERWWAKITSSSGVSRYRCVRRRDHWGVHKERTGTARWHWLPDDPNGWQDCDAGCCETGRG